MVNKDRATMKQFFVFLGFLAYATAFTGMYGNPYAGYHAFMNTNLPRMTQLQAQATPEVDIPNDSLRSTMKMQSTQVAETTLSGHSNKGCFLRTVCAVGTLDSQETPQLSMAQGILEFKRLLEEMVIQVDETEAARKENFPNIRKTLASFEVGASTNDLRLCEQLFPCRTLSAEALVSDALAVPNTSVREGRTTCAASGNLCPGVNIGCSLCGIFLDGTCSLQCTIAGFYCGISGYACMAEAESAVKTAMEEISRDDAKQKEFMKFLFGDLAEHLDKDN